MKNQKLRRFTTHQCLIASLFFTLLIALMLVKAPLSISAETFNGAALAEKYNKAAINYVDKMYTNKNTVLSLMRTTYDNREYAEISAFAKDLSKGAKTNEEKSQRFFNWITENVTYSYDGSSYGAYDVMTKKKAVCMGYSVLYAEMLRSQKIPTVIVTGHGRSPGLALDKDTLFYTAPHAWVMVYLDNTWKIIDPTKGSYDISISDFNKQYCTWAVENITPSYSGIDYTDQNTLYYVNGNVYYYEQGKIVRENPGLSSSLNNYVLCYRSIGNGTINTTYHGSTSVPKGAMYKDGWLTYQGDKFYALPNGTLVCNTWFPIKGVTYRFNHNGDRLPYSSKVTSTGFQYKISSDKKTVTIVAYTGTAKNVAIPSKIAGLPVTRIGEHAFYKVSCTSVTIPEGIQFIDDNAFWMCPVLETVTLPKTLKELGTTTNESYIPGSAFSDCPSLKKITLPSSLKTIENGTFSFSFQGGSFTVPGSVSALQPYTFTAADLKTITLKEGVMTIGEYAFSCMDTLTTLYLPSTITSIQKKAFSDTPNVTIVAKKGSYAYNWAKDNKVKVKAADSISYKLSSSRSSITLGKTKTLSLTTTAGKKISNNITWKSYDTSVATVKNGVITAKKIGTCAVLATYNGTTTACVITVNPATVTNVSMSRLHYQTIRKATVSWNKQANVTGYEVHRATSKNGTYTKVRVTTKSLSYTDMTVKKGKTYYYKVRTYVNVNGVKYYSGYSKTVKVSF